MKMLVWDGSRSYVFDVKPTNLLLITFSAKIASITTFSSGQIATVKLFKQGVLAREAHWNVEQTWTYFGRDRFRFVGLIMMNFIQSKSFILIDRWRGGLVVGNRLSVFNRLIVLNRLIGIDRIDRLILFKQGG